MLNRQIVFTVIALVITVVLFEFSSIDIWVQDQFYNAELQQWLWDKDEPIAKLILYDGIKRLFIVFVVSLFACLFFYRNKEWIKAYKKGLLIVCISAVMVPLVIGSLKATTNIACPKDLVGYGGDVPYVKLFESYPLNYQQSKQMKCYPAGHASGGFALLSLFFLFKSRKNRWAAVASVMTVSWVIGGYKMIIGDHFLSHTIVSMLLAWLLILLVAKMVLSYPKDTKRLM